MFILPAYFTTITKTIVIELTYDTIELTSLRRMWRESE